MLALRKICQNSPAHVLGPVLSRASQALVVTAVVLAGTVLKNAGLSAKSEADVA